MVIKKLFYFLFFLNSNLVENRTFIKNYEFIPIFYDDLIEMYWKNKEIFKARRLFSVMPNRNDHTPKNVAALAIKQNKNAQSVLPNSVFEQTMKRFTNLFSF